MATPHKIVVTVDEDGEVKVAVAGYRGTGCKALTRALEAALGLTTGDEVTREYGMTEQTQAQQTRQGGSR